MEVNKIIDDPKWIANIQNYARTWFAFVIYGPYYFFKKSFRNKKAYLSPVHFLIINAILLSIELSLLTPILEGKGHNKEYYLAFSIALTLSYILMFPIGIVILALIKKLQYMNRLVVVVCYSTSLAIVELLFIARLEWASEVLGFVDIFEAMRHYSNSNAIYLYSLILPFLIFLLTSYYFISGLLAINRLKRTRFLGIMDRIVPPLLVTCIVVSPGIIAGQQRNYLSGLEGVQINALPSCVGMRIWESVKEKKWVYDLVFDEDQNYPVDIHVHNTGNREATNVLVKINASDDYRMIGSTITADNWCCMERNYVVLRGPGTVAVEKMQMYENRDQKYEDYLDTMNVEITGEHKNRTVKIFSLPPGKDLIVRYRIKTSISDTSNKSMKLTP